MRSSSGTSQFVVAVIVIILIMFGFTVYIIYRSSQVPLLEVSDVSLNPNTINQNGNATLSFTIKNNDAVNSHNITVTFNVTGVTFYDKNRNSLYNDSDGIQYYRIQLPSFQKSTYDFGVKGNLSGGATESTYSINLNFFDENDTRFDSETQSLTVTS
jgi:hypothetical protein